MKYADREAGNPRVVTSIGISSHARAALQEMAEREGTSRSAIVERMILAASEVSRQDRDLSESSGQGV